MIQDKMVHKTLQCWAITVRNLIMKAHHQCMIRDYFRR